MQACPAAITCFSLMRACLPHSVLADLAKTASDLRQAHTKALEQLAEATVPRLRPVLDEVAAVGVGDQASASHDACKHAAPCALQVSYQLSDVEYSLRESEEGWAHRLLAALQTHMQWLQPFLTTNNYEASRGRQDRQRGGGLLSSPPLIDQPSLRLYPGSSCSAAVR